MISMYFNFIVRVLYVIIFFSSYAAPRKDVHSDKGRLSFLAENMFMFIKHTPQNDMQ